MSSSTSFCNRKPSEISFFYEQGKSLTVTIDTERLHLRSVNSEDVNSYASLFGNAKVMEKYADGKTKTKEEIETRIKEIWEKRWKGDDPYSGLAVFEKKSKKFIGHVVIGHGEKKGQAEIAYLFNEKFWGKGFEEEAVTAVVKDYALETIVGGYALDGKKLKTITTTVRSDNPASIKILEQLGMHKIGEEEKYGAQHLFFSIDVGELKKI